MSFDSSAPIAKGRARDALKTVDSQAQQLVNKLAYVQKVEAQAWKKVGDNRARQAKIQAVAECNKGKPVAQAERRKKKLEELAEHRAQHAYERQRDVHIRQAQEQVRREDAEGKATQSKEDTRQALDILRDRAASLVKQNEEKVTKVKRRKEQAVQKVAALKADKVHRRREEHQLLADAREPLKQDAIALTNMLQQQVEEAMQRLHKARAFEVDTKGELEGLVERQNVQYAMQSRANIEMAGSRPLASTRSNTPRSSPPRSPSRASPRSP